MNLKVCEGIEIVNVDGHQLETLKRTSNTLDTGASTILEALSMYIEDLYDKYQDEPTVPFDKLFYALRQVISSGSEKQSVREALLTGYLNANATDRFSVPKPEVKTEIVTKIVYREKSSRNKSAITKYAKTHTLMEIKEHFNFPSRDSAKDYLRRNQINFVHQKAGRHAINLPLEQVKDFAKSMRLCELTRAFGCTKRQMMLFCQKNQIEYQGARK